MAYEVDCKTMNKLKKRFFNADDMTVTVRDIIIDHLLTCKECYENYKKYASEIDKKFNLREYALKFVEENAHRLNLRTRDRLKELGFEKDMEYQEHKWETIATKFDLYKLRNLVSFQNFMQEKVEAKLSDKDKLLSLNEWAKYMAKKIAIDVDKLELCYHLSKGDEDKNEDIE